MPDFISTNRIFEVLTDQLETQLSGTIDDVIPFDGSLESAVETHFSQATETHAGVVVFYGFTEDIPEQISAGGDPLRQGLALDFYVVLRSKGRAHYQAERTRLFNVSDSIMFNVFDHANYSANMKAVCPVMRFQSRRRVVTGSSLMSHVLRFIATPKRSE